MSAFPSALLPANRESELAAALNGSACLGAWTHDIPADRFTVAVSLGGALALAPDEAAGVPLSRVLYGVHFEDRERIESMLHAAWETGGPFEVEFRTWSGQGGSRWLRLMGCTDMDESRRPLRARGLAFDLTEGRLGRGTPAQQSQRQVNQLADHVIAMKGLVSGLRNPQLAQLVDRMAVEIGFELARRLTQAEDRSRH